jgi:hypothetical protein
MNINLQMMRPQGIAFVAYFTISLNIYLLTTLGTK